MKLLNFTVLLISLLFIFSCTEEDDGLDFTDDRDKFIGTWQVTENCSKDVYTVSIQADPSNSSQVLIQNFWNLANCQVPPYAIAAGGTLFLPSQGICDGSFEVEGEGDLESDDILWSYSVNDGADLFTCTATYVKVK